MNIEVLDSPIGPLYLGATTRGLSFVCFEGALERHTKKFIHDKAYLNSLDSAPSKQILKKSAKQLEKYFDGDLQALKNLKIDPQGTTFQKKVWSALNKTKPGTTITYGQLAKKIGSPRASRAVGHAMRDNPICLAIPCHRVIGHDGKLVGFNAGIKRKVFLLKHEGALAA